MQHLSFFVIFAPEPTPEEKAAKAAAELVVKSNYLNTTEEAEAFAQELNKSQLSDNTGLHQRTFDSLQLAMPDIFERAKSRELASQMHTGYYIATDFVKKQLKVPSSAKFLPYDEIYKIYYNDKDVFHYEFDVQAQNSFGVMVNSRYAVELRDMGDAFILVDLKQIK